MYFNRCYISFSVSEISRFYSLSHAEQSPRVVKLFFMLNSVEHEISTDHKNLKYCKVKKFLALSLSDVVFIILINYVKMPFVGILTFMSRINFVLS